MRKAFYLTVVFTLILSTGTAYSVEDRIYTAEELLIENLTIYDKNNKLPINGIVRLYYESGKLKRESSYKNGKKHGVDKEYYESGTLKRESSLKDGIQHGVDKLYFESGTLKADVPFDKGKINGISKVYKESGELMTKVLYKNGKAISGYIYDLYGNKIKMTGEQIKKLD